MPRTEEQKEAARELLAKGRALRAQQQREAREMKEDRPDEPEALDGDDVLTQLISTLAAARNKKANQSKVMAQLAELFDQVDPQANPELLEDPTVAAFVDKINAGRMKQAERAGLPPGTQIGTGLAQDAVVWRYSDLDRYCTKCNCPPEKWAPDKKGCGIFPCPTGTPDLVENFIPPITQRVTWNGLDCQFNAGEEMPPFHRVFLDVYRESLRLARVADQHKAFMMGESDTLPPELMRGDQAVATMRARAFMNAGAKKGGGSIIVGYGGDDKFGMRDFQGGDQAVVPTETTSA